MNEAEHVNGVRNCTPTDDHVEGPFYRPGAPELTDLYPSESDGPVLYFSGTVADTDCKPLGGTVIEVWQADNQGHYDNDDPAHLPAPTYFRCRGRMTVDDDGRFLFRTVLPNNYPVPGENWTRVKHVHFKLFAHGVQPLTTEIELLPDDYTQQDQLYNPHLAVTLQPVAQPKGPKPEYQVHYDFVLQPVSARGYALAAKSAQDTASRAAAKRHTSAAMHMNAALQSADRSTPVAPTVAAKALSSSVPQASNDQNPFVGVWTYRSFINKPELVTDFNDIALWQATLTLKDDGRFLVKGWLEGGEDVLDVNGSISMECDPPEIRLRAVDAAGSALKAGWIYDYVGTLTYEWPDGDGQRPAIVGTVIRTVPHAPNRQAGLSYSFVAVNQQVPPSAYQLPDSVVKHFADRMHRLHHSIWHGIRGGGTTWMTRRGR